MDNDKPQKFWSNGKPRVDKPSCIKPRDKNGNVIKPGKSDTITSPKAPKAHKKQNVRDNIPVNLPPKGPKTNHRKFSSLEYEFKHKVIGAAHNLGKESRGKIMKDIAYACKFMQDKMHLNSIRSMKEHHIKAYAEYMRNEQVSQKTKGEMNVSTVYDRISNACWMYRIMNPTEKQLMPKDIEVTKTRAAVQNPVDFTKPQYSNYKADREAIHNWIATHYSWQKAPDRVGQEFGMREMERAGTRGHTITRIDGKLHLDKGDGYKPTTVRQLTQTYGHASYGKYSQHVKEGVHSLVVEWSKDNLGRFVPIEKQSQWDAIKDLREACKAVNSPSGRPIPWTDANGERYTKEQAVKAFDNAWQGAKNALGLTGKENYGFTCNGDRHRYVQQCVVAGLTDREIIVRVGHFDKDKLDFYRRK